MAIKLFSHTDMDGVSPYILLRYYFPKENISYNFCNYGDIDEKVSEFINSKEYLNFSAIYITDISVSKENAERLQKISDELNLTIRLFDHHKTALHLNEFDFCSVITEKNGEAICGTKLFYEYLTKERNLEEKDFISRYVKYVNDYDTWLWEDKYQYILPYQWNVLFIFYGKLTFIKNVLEKFKNEQTKFSDIDELILNVEEQKKKTYIQNKMNDVIEKKIQNKNCVIVFAESYANDLTSEMGKKYPHSEIQIVIGQRGISYRSRNVDEIDLGEFAKNYGGGGHPKAAGSPLSKEIKMKWLNDIFD